MQPQLVHAHLFKSNILASLAAWLAGVPCLLHDHSGMDADGLKFYFPNAISRFLYSSAYLIALKVSASVLVLTPQMRTATLHHYHLPPAKVTVLPNAIDLERSISGMEVRQSLRDELELSASSQLIVMVGRMAPEKDWSTFIEIASYFTVRHQYAFLAVGSGKMELELRKLVHDKGLENFQFLGDRQDVASILTQSEVLVLTSRQEAFGIVLLEAMAVGCPVIAARAAGPIAIIQNGVNGLLVEIRDVTGFVNAINQVLSDPELAGRLAENAHRSVRQYDVNTVVQQLSNTYSSLLHEPGDPL
jgi:glycosyltransferase involved in cell wall biosynthesis